MTPLAVIERREIKHVSKGICARAHEDALAELVVRPAPHNLTAPCDVTFAAKHHSGPRHLSSIKWIVMHDTEGDTALGAAAWFANPRSSGSAHLCVDDNYCYRTLPDKLIPWGAPGVNTGGFHIEQAGHASWTSIIWSKTHRKTLERGAYKAALHCRKYGIPPYFVKADGLKLGVAGVTTHWEATKAFGGSHTDPGFGWPRLYFMRRLRYHYKQLAHIERIA